jgi:hypothetical protein
MINRRSFLGLVLAGCVAPAFVRAEYLMRGHGLVVPSIDTAGRTFWVDSSFSEGGDGSKLKPFSTLAAAMAITRKRDTINIITAEEARVILKSCTLHGVGAW